LQLWALACIRVGAKFSISRNPFFPAEAEDLTQDVFIEIYRKAAISTGENRRFERTEQRQLSGRLTEC
jgi:hypothetical protein